MRALVALTAVLLAATTSGEEPKKTKDSPWQKHFREQAGDYRFEFADEASPATKLVSDPLMFWSQPVRGGNEGAVYLWTRQGRPVAIATLFIWPPAEGMHATTHEFHSLMSVPFTATWKARQWSAPKKAITFRALAESPAATPERRLTQLKRLARQFEAESQGSDGNWTQLRLLPRELYRYPAADDPAKVSDGAVLGFVQGTDLEVVLLLETASLGDKSVWHYAFARMSDLPLRVERGGQEVWSVEKGEFDDAKAAWFCGTVEQRTQPPQ